MLVCRGTNADTDQCKEVKRKEKHLHYSGLTYWDVDGGCACVHVRVDLLCVRADVGECKEIKEERKMNLLVSGDGGHVGVWIHLQPQA